jgi:hypothetical protein
MLGHVDGHRPDLDAGHPAAGLDRPGRRPSKGATGIREALILLRGWVAVVVPPIVATPAVIFLQLIDCGMC